MTNTHLLMSERFLALPASHLDCSASGSYYPFQPSLSEHRITPPLCSNTKSSFYPLCRKPYSKDESISTSSLEQQNKTVVIQQLVIPPFSHSLLHRTQLHSDNKFSLRWHVLENISFEASQHMWAQHVM